IESPSGLKATLIQPISPLAPVFETRVSPVFVSQIVSVGLLSHSPLTAASRLLSGLKAMQFDCPHTLENFRCSFQVATSQMMTSAGVKTSPLDAARSFPSGL